MMFQSPCYIEKKLFFNFLLNTVFIFIFGTEKNVFTIRSLFVILFFSTQFLNVAFLGLVHSFPLTLYTLFMLQGCKIHSCYTSDVQRTCSSPDSHLLVRGKLYFTYICFKIWCDQEALIVSGVSCSLRINKRTQSSEILCPSQLILHDRDKDVPRGPSWQRGWFMVMRQAVLWPFLFLRHSVILDTLRLPGFRFRTHWYCRLL